jgi:hypothetical protein
MSKALPTSKTNRRQYLRVVPEALSPVRVDINGVDFIEVCKAFDISEGGLRILVPHRFEGCHIDRPVELIVHLPAPVNKLFKAEGLIRHVASDSFGVRFTTINDRAVELIRAYIMAWVRRNDGWVDYLRYRLGWMR